MLGKQEVDGSIPSGSIVEKVVNPVVLAFPDILVQIARADWASG
jgi:hypothetical protein